MSQIEYHYQTIGRILTFLVRRGLARTDLDESSAMEIMTERRGDEEVVLSTFSDCLQWMVREGLIHVQTIHEHDGGYDFNGVQLSSLGIEIIKRDPKDTEIGTSIEKRVEESGGKDLGAPTYTKIGSFVGGALGGFTKAISG
jgi:hypothetical protein